MDDTQFKKILDIFNLSWQGYRRVRKGVKKRLFRHMQQMDCRDVDEYLDRINAHPDIFQETRRLMTVSVSRFFRDRTLWEICKEKLIPDILSKNPDRVHVWSAGCALGQEVYSFKIIWQAIEKNHGPLPSLHVLATDLNPEYRRKAIEAIYNRHAVRDIPQDILENFFHRFEDRYAVSDHLKTNISWEISDLTNPPRDTNRFQIIFLRNNLLTYYMREIIETVFTRIMDNLAVGGYLIIGVRENLPCEYPCLSKWNDHPYIFCKRENRY